MKKLLALILAAICALSLGGCGSGRLLAAPAYPEMARYPVMSEYSDSESGEFDRAGYDKAYDAWSEGCRAQREQDVNYARALESYLRRSIPQLLAGEGAENRVCSPVNIYIALAMLAETTDGDSRAQILELLDSDSLESLRDVTAALWNANYRDDGSVASVPANSLWLSDRIRYVPDTVEALSGNYYASVFQGRMGSDKLNAALQSWVSEQTGGLLEQQAAGLKTDSKTALALISTFYFRAFWLDKFSENATYAQTFRAPDGEIECDFMHGSESRRYYKGENFTAMANALNSDGYMWFILPNERVTPEQLINDETALDFLLSGGRRNADSKTVTVNLALPKFDVSSELQLSESLGALGVTDVFDGEVSDFSPLNYGGDGLFLDQAEHAARVAVDEYGVVAAAYTASMFAAADNMPPEDQVDFVLDRPFVFAITSHDGLPLFVGIVNEP